VGGGGVHNATCAAGTEGNSGLRHTSAFFQLSTHESEVGPGLYEAQRIGTLRL
jgi:hypothetical protein